MTAILIAGLSIGIFVFPSLNCNTGKSHRVDEQKNKAIENLTNTDLVLYLFKKGRFSEGLEAFCLMQEAARKATANKCDKRISRNIGADNIRDCHERMKEVVEVLEEKTKDKKTLNIVKKKIFKVVRPGLSWDTCIRMYEKKW